MYNGILQVYLDMEAHISSATQITQKEPKETTKRKGNILNHNGPEVNLQLNTLHRMCNETGIPEFLEFQIPGIPMVVIVTSRARSLRNPTQQDFINARNLSIYKCHTRFKF